MPTSVPPAPSRAPCEAETKRALPIDGVADAVFGSIKALDAVRLVTMFSGPMQSALPVEKAVPWMAGIVAAKGKLLTIDREAGQGGERSGVYRFGAERGEWRVELQIDKDGKVLGLKFGDPPVAPPVVKSTLPLKLPFRDEWSVFWGGDTLEVNQHLPHKSQRRAADLVRVDTTGRTHSGDGKRNDDYYAYGEEIFAVADGTVVTVIDGVPENTPGTMNPYFALGNIVIIAHAGGVHSAYAHLQPGKLRVKVGAKVNPGTVLGLCGNSGNSSEPHLHFQLQDGPRFESSWGIEPVFESVAVVRDGKREVRNQYTWLKGDRVGENRKR